MRLTRVQAARLLLKRHFATVQTLSDPAHLATLTKRASFDVLLLDMPALIDEKATEDFARVAEVAQALTLERGGWLVSTMEQ